MFMFKLFKYFFRLLLCNWKLHKLRLHSRWHFELWNKYSSGSRISPVGEGSEPPTLKFNKQKGVEIQKGQFLGKVFLCYFVRAVFFFYFIVGVRTLLVIRSVTDVLRAQSRFVKVCKPTLSLSFNWFLCIYLGEERGCTNGCKSMGTQLAITAELLDECLGNLVGIKNSWPLTCVRRFCHSSHPWGPGGLSRECVLRIPLRVVKGD